MNVQWRKTFDVQATKRSREKDFRTIKNDINKQIIKILLIYNLVEELMVSTFMIV